MTGQYCTISTQILSTTGVAVTTVYYRKWRQKADPFQNGCNASNGEGRAEWMQCNLIINMEQNARPGTNVVRKKRKFFQKNREKPLLRYSLQFSSIDVKFTLYDAKLGDIRNQGARSPTLRSASCVLRHRFRRRAHINGIMQLRRTS